MVSLIDILVLVGILSVCFQFWQLRQQAEVANKHAKRYCEQNSLQFISCARKKTRLQFFKKKLVEWQSQYEFEFSGNGEDANRGWLVMQDNLLSDISAEPYRV